MIYITQLVVLLLTASSIRFASPTASGPGSSTIFNPNLNDFDAYGLKLAVNDYISVEVQPSRQVVIVQVAPSGFSSRPITTCAVNFGIPNFYIYAVAVGRYQTSPQFAYIGQDSNNKTEVGFANYTGSLCSFNWLPVRTLGNSHEEFFVLDVDATGSIAYTFTQEYSNSYTIAGAVTNHTPISFQFMPHAVAVFNNCAVVAGFSNNTNSAQQLFIPVVYLVPLPLSSLAASAPWQYTAPSGTWQAELTNSGADTWSARFDMSVSVSDTGRVLVGIPSVNTVFLFQINSTTSPPSLTLIGNITSAQATVGFGKGVAWLDPAVGTQAAILNNVYTLLDYQWVSSQVQVYSIPNTSPFSYTALFVWPNSQQTLATTFNPSLLNIVSTANSTLGVLDISGNVYLILKSSPGIFSQTNVGAGANPSISTPADCLPGMYKNITSIGPCSLCPMSTRNPGGNPSIGCQSCLNNSVCPLGSTADISYSAVDVISQAVAYPNSPELTAFDDILLENMFSIGSTNRCLVISPAFWALMSMVVSLVILVSIVILQYFPRMRKLHFGLKGFFRRTDLVREGEMWTGGLASLAILVFIGFAAYFSNSFLQQYPIETVGDSYFACDVTLRNAKFFTDVQSLGTPPLKEEQPIFDMMNSQSFILNIDFVQTNFTCGAVSVYNTRLTIPTSVPFTCPTQSISNILSVSVNLTSVNNNLQIVLSGILPIGGVRIGMAAPEQMENEYLVRQLNFLQPFYANNCILAPQSTFTLELTKVINITEPLGSSGTTQYSALFIPSFLVNLDQTFISQTDYNSISSFTQTSISIAMSETSYYINNNQSPIAKQTEIIFQNILFALVCIEIFGFGFLICKLFFLPVIEYFLRKYRGENKHGTNNNEERRRSSD